MLRSSELSQIELSPREFPRTWEALNAGVSEGVAPGMVSGLWLAREPDRIRLAATGQRRVIPSPEPVQVDTFFDLASVSKIFATATLAHVLIDRGWIRWDTDLKSVFPNYPHAGIQVRHLLSHTAGFPAWAPFFEKIREKFAPRPLHLVSVEERQTAMRALVFSAEPDAAVETRALYSDVSFLVLGFLLEEVTSMPLDQAVSRLLWEPMGIPDAFYVRTTKSAAKGKLDFVAATERCPWRGDVLQGQVHDDNCWAMGGYAGHAGAFARASDVLHFSRALFGGFLSRETLARAWSRAPKPEGCERTYGWDTPSGAEPSAGPLFSPRSVGHLGFTGTSLWIDLDAELSVVLLTNRVHPERDNLKIRAFRPRFHRAIREDLLSLESR